MLSLCHFFDMCQSSDNRWAYYESLIAVKKERELILDALSTTGKSAYGFTSLFGPLDHMEAGQDDFRKLLDYHSRPVFSSDVDTIPHSALYMIGAKIHHISLGGTGISEQSYRHLLVSDIVPADVSLSGSYSSGDVVPGACLISQIFPDDYEWPVGDVMALINGSHVALGASFSAFLSALESLALAWDAITKSCQPVRFFGHSYLYPSTYHQGWDEPPQLPVSHRDVAPLVTSQESALSYMADVLVSVLNQPSANPLWIKENGEYIATSSSSFLDYRLTNGLVMLSHEINRMAGLLVRCVDYHASQSTDPRTPQYPKIMEGLRQSLKHLSWTGDYVGHQSGGVEDVWAHTSQYALTVYRQTCLLSQIIDILCEYFYIPRPLPRDTRTLLQHASS